MYRMKFKFDRADSYCQLMPFDILPSIRITTQYELRNRNFSIEFHLWFFHARVRFREEYV